MAIFRNGKRLEGAEADSALKRHNAILASHGRSPSGDIVQARQTTGGSGSKGGSKPSYDPQTEADLLERAQAKYNTDNRYGYYNNQGQYVGFMQDATDGGGMNTTDTFFKGGPLSTLLNVAKVRPAGMSRVKDDAGEFIVPRADVGFRDATDMTDRGGPQTAGGQFQGGGTLSKAANFVDFLADREATKPVRYDRTGSYDPNFYIPNNYSQPDRKKGDRLEMILRSIAGQ